MNKLKAYISEASNELLNKVTWPTWKELQDSAIIVLIASVIFALIVYVMDTAFNFSLDMIYGFFK